MSRLTSVANVKGYLAIGNTNQDALISDLITRESTALERYCSRRFAFFSGTQRLNGTGTSRLALPQAPILTVSQVTICGTQNIPASTGPTVAGYVLEGPPPSGPTFLTLVEGCKFPQGLANVTVTWTAGWRATGNAPVPAFVPAGNVTVGPVTLDAEQMTFSDSQPTDIGFPTVDRGVVGVYANVSVTLTSVAASANGPLTQQYSFDAGVYTFNSVDAGVALSMTFDYVPADVEQACIEMVGLDLKQRDNLGVSSKTLAGESITYDKRNMIASSAAMLQPYKRTIPV